MDISSGKVYLRRDGIKVLIESMIVDKKTNSTWGVIYSFIRDRNSKKICSLINFMGQFIPDTGRS